MTLYHRHKLFFFVLTTALSNYSWKVETVFKCEIQETYYDRFTQFSLAQKVCL